MTNLRYRKITDPFQWRIFLRILTYGFIYQITVWNLMFCWQLVREGGNFLEEYRQFYLESYPMLFAVLILAPVFAWDAVKYCHRIAGPVYRFRATARSVAAGQPVSLIKLRKGDELLTLRDDLNAMLSALAERGAIELVTVAPKLVEPTRDDSLPVEEPQEPVLAQ